MFFLYSASSEVHRLNDGEKSRKVTRSRLNEPCTVAGEKNESSCTRKPHNLALLSFHFSRFSLLTVRSIRRRSKKRVQNILTFNLCNLIEFLDTNRLNSKTSVTLSIPNSRITDNLSRTNRFTAPSLRDIHHISHRNLQYSSFHFHTCYNLITGNTIRCRIRFLQFDLFHFQHIQPDQFHFLPRSC